MPPFKPGLTGSNPGVVRNYNFYPGTGWAAFVYVLACFVSGRGLDILLNTYSGRPALLLLSSVLLHNLATPTGI